MRRGVVVAVLLVGLGVAWFMGAFIGEVPVIVAPVSQEMEAVCVGVEMA